MANIPKRAIKKFTKPAHREIATGILIAYGLFPRTQDGIDKASRLIAGRETWLAPSDLPDYYDNIESDLMTGKDTPGIKAIRNSLKEFYGLDNKPVTTPKLKPTKTQPTTDQTQIYKPDDKFVDDVQEELKEKLEETSDEIMNAIDELIAQQKRDFEEFKRKQQEQLESRRKTRENTDPDQYSEPIGPQQRKRNRGKTQYSDPIGPDPTIPKDRQLPPGQDEPEEEWESEVPDQLGTKLDELLEQVRTDPLPQPSTDRRKTKGKKPLNKKKPISQKGSKIGETLHHIMANVVDTRVALFDLYKITKARFEFKKKIDKQLTASLNAKLREKQIESDPKALKKEGVGGIIESGKSTLKEGLLAGLVGGLVSTALPLIIQQIRPFIDRDAEPTALSEWWRWFVPPPSESAEPSVRDGTRTKEKEAEGFRLFWEDIFRSPEKSNEPSVREGLRTPQTGFGTVPSMNEKGEQYPVQTGKTSEPVPVRKAAVGGLFDNGKVEPLKPLSVSPIKDSKVKSLTKPLGDVPGLLQKSSSVGTLSFVNNILSPFGPFIPKQGKDFVKSIYDNVARSSGLTGMKLELSSTDIFKKIQDALNKILNSLLGGTANAAPRPTGTTPTGTTPTETTATVGKGLGGSGQDFATLATIAALESGSAQGQADVAQSVYNRLGDTGQRYGKSITEILTRQGQYQVAFRDPTAKSGPGTQVADVFKNIKNEDDAVKAIQYYYRGRGQSISEQAARQKFRSASKSISDPALMKSAAQHVGGRTEFLSGSQYQSGDAYRGGAGDNTFFAKYGSGTQMQRGAQAAPKGLINEPPKPAKVPPPPPEPSPKRNMFQNLISQFFPQQKPQPQPKLNPPASPVGKGAPQQPGS